MAHEYLGFQTRKTRGKAAAGKPKIEVLTAEPMDLWSSGRGTEIGVIAWSKERLWALIESLSEQMPTRPSEITHKDDDLYALILWGVGGQRAVTLVAEPSLASDRISIVADETAPRAAVLKAVRSLLGPGVPVAEGA